MTTMASFSGSFGWEFFVLCSLFFVFVGDDSGRLPSRRDDVSSSLVNGTALRA